MERARAEPAKVSVSLKVETGSDPIMGRITFQDGAERAFCGYMQLVGALERVRRSESPPAVPPELADQPPGHPDGSSAGTE